MAVRRRTRGRLLAGALAGCVAVALLDQAAPQVTAPLRSGAATVFGPVQSALTGGSAKVDRLTRERDAARAAAGTAATNASTLAALRALRGSATADGRTFIAAQVIGYTTGATPTQVQQVMIDVGTDDGITTDLTVIAAGGLVGRTVAVAKTSATVQLLTDPGAVVGTRTGTAGVLGSISGKTPAGLPTRAAGLLTLRVAGSTAVANGDLVRSLGSIDDTPFVRDVPIGHVVSVDPDRGQGAVTATVRPLVDGARLNVVGVVIPAGKVGSRPVVQGQR